MSHRAALPEAAVTISPGYSWRIDLDVKFDGVRPADWSAWEIRMHVWCGAVEFSLTSSNGVTIESIDVGDGVLVDIPVIRMTAAQTESLRNGRDAIQYVIDFKAPGGEVEDYFAGNMKRIFSPPAGLLA